MRCRTAKKGYNYTTVNENNIPTDLKNINDTDDAHKMHATDGAPICNGYYYGSDELNYAATAMDFHGYEDVVADSLMISNNGAYEPISFTRTIQSRIDYGTTIISKEAELLVQVVTCKPEDFDATWDKYTNEIPFRRRSADYRRAASGIQGWRIPRLLSDGAEVISARKLHKRGLRLGRSPFFGITLLIFLFFLIEIDKESAWLYDGSVSVCFDLESSVRAALPACIPTTS